MALSTCNGGVTPDTGGCQRCIFYKSRFVKLRKNEYLITFHISIFGHLVQLDPVGPGPVSSVTVQVQNDAPEKVCFSVLQIHGEYFQNTSTWSPPELHPTTPCPYPLTH